MKVTIDAILSTAIDMKNQKNINEESLKNDGQKVKADSIEIKNRLASRLGIIQNELKNLQSSLTKNQIIQEGISQLKEDFDNGRGNINFILDKVKFEDEHVLNDFLGKKIDYEKILNGGIKVEKLIDKDIKDLKSLQVEIENIVASNLADSEISEKISQLERSLLNINLYSVSHITDLKPDTVMELIK